MPRIAVNAALALLALWQLQGLHFAGHVLQELRPAMMEACVSSAKLVLLQGQGKGVQLCHIEDTKHSR